MIKSVIGFVGIIAAPIIIGSPIHNVASRSADNVALEMIARYRSLTSYADSGRFTMRDSAAGQPLFTGTFTTFYARPTLLKIDSTMRFDFGNRMTERKIVWADGVKVYSWRDGMKVAALDGGNLHTAWGGTHIRENSIVPPLLEKSFARGTAHLHQLRAAELLEDAVIGRTQCYHLRGLGGSFGVSARVDVWVGHKDLLIRKVAVENTEPAYYLETLFDDISVNIRPAPDMFKVAPPN